MALDCISSTGDLKKIKKILVLCFVTKEVLESKCTIFGDASNINEYRKRKIVRKYNFQQFIYVCVGKGKD